MPGKSWGSHPQSLIGGKGWWELVNTSTVDRDRQSSKANPLRGLTNSGRLRCEGQHSAAWAPSTSEKLLGLIPRSWSVTEGANIDWEINCVQYSAGQRIQTWSIRSLSMSSLAGMAVGEGSTGREQWMMPVKWDQALPGEISRDFRGNASRY